MLARFGLIMSLAGLLLAGCGKGRADDHPPQWMPICVASHGEVRQVMVVDPSAGLRGGIPMGGWQHLVLQNITVCDKREWFCNTGGPAYQGERVCPAKPIAAP